MLDGTALQLPVNGQATFSDLWIGAADTYTLTALDGNDTPATFGPFTVAGPQTSNDLTATIQRNTLPNTFVPGDRGVTTIQLTNHSGSLANGIVHIQLFLTPDRVGADGVLLTTPALNRVPVVLPNGRSRPVVSAFASAGRDAG